MSILDNACVAREVFDYLLRMRIQFCGADRTVTGSSHLIEINGLRVFLEMGLYQGSREVANRLNASLPADVKSADAIILSHGHLDHCGKLPVALRTGFSGPIYCTPATAEVARIVLADSAKIQQEDVEYLRHRARNPGEPPPKMLYGVADIPNVVKRFKRIPYQQKTDLGKGVSFTFFDAGHILGSAYVLMEWNEGGKPRSLVFTADVGRYDAPILRDPQPLPGPVSVVITESTYGNTFPRPDRGGWASVSRRREILYREKEPDDRSVVCCWTDADGSLVSAKVHRSKADSAASDFRGQPDGC